VKITEFDTDPGAEAIRALAPAARAVEDDVRAIVDAVRAGGDRALLELTERFDGAALSPGQLRVPQAQLESALAALDPAVEQALETAIANVRAVAAAQLREPVVTDLPAGQRIEIAESPVRRVGAYVPAGRAPYPSTLVMIAVTALAAGVDEVAVCAAPAADGTADPVIRAACALCGVTELYLMGGAQAVAALAYGTDSVRAVDLVAGPGNRYVQEAKRQVCGVVGIDGIAGPSELVVVADGDQDADALALDLLAQAEHGEDGIQVFISADAGLLRAVRAAVDRLAPERPSVTDAPLAFVAAADTAGAVRLADAIAPEHLELAGPESEALVGAVRAAGAVFIGPAAATAFGDYVAGSNHVLPTGGAARFQSALSAATFRRRMARVSLPPAAARRLAPDGAALARAEGFPVHAESMERRA
jgi:histidinol dehydrogenase